MELVLVVCVSLNCCRWWFSAVVGLDRRGSSEVDVLRISMTESANANNRRFCRVVFCVEMVDSLRYRAGGWFPGRSYMVVGGGSFVRAETYMYFRISGAPT
jgi:hypothetical protein